MRAIVKIAIAAPFFCGLLATTPAKAGLIGTIFINEDLVITVPPGFILVSITKVLTLIGDPLTINESGLPGTFYNNYYNPPNDSVGGPTVTTHGKLTDVTFPIGSGAPVSGPPGPHVGFQVCQGTGGICSGTAGPVTLVEDPDVFQTFYTLKNTATGKLTNVQLPIINAALTSTNNIPPVFDTIFAFVTRDGVTSGEYFEIPEGSGASVKLNNPSGPPVTLTDAEYRLSPTELPLDLLNFTDLPPTGPGWTPLPGYPNGTVLKAPEPASIALLSFGVFSLLGARRK